MQLELVGRGAQRCIGEDLPEEVPVQLAFRALELEGGGGGGGGFVRVELIDPLGSAIYSKDLQPEDGVDVYQFKSTTEGIFKVCFQNQEQERGVIEVDPIREIYTTDFVRAIKEEELQPLELIFRRAEDAARSIDAEMDYVIQRESHLLEAGEQMEWRVNAFSVLSIVILLITGAWQMVYLRRFFTMKKLL